MNLPSQPSLYADESSCVPVHFALIPELSEQWSLCCSSVDDKSRHRGPGDCLSAPSCWHWPALFSSVTWTKAFLDLMIAPSPPVAGTSVCLVSGALVSPFVQCDSADACADSASAGLGGFVRFPVVRYFRQSFTASDLAALVDLLRLPCSGCFIPCYRPTICLCTCIYPRKCFC